MLLVAIRGRKFVSFWQVLWYYGTLPDCLPGIDHHFANDRAVSEDTL